MTYEEERAERIEWRKKLVAVVEALGFSLVQKTDEQSWDTRVTGTKNGEGIHLSTSTYDKGKIWISGVYPRTAKGEYIRPHEYNEKDHSIGVSITKSVEQIVKDIERRFFPLYRERLAKVEARVASSNHYENETEANLEYLKGSPLTEGEKSNKSLWVEIGERHLTVKVSGENASLDLSYVPVETVKKVIELLKGEVK